MRSEEDLVVELHESMVVHHVGVIGRKFFATETFQELLSGEGELPLHNVTRIHQDGTPLEESIITVHGVSFRSILIDELVHEIRDGLPLRDHVLLGFLLVLTEDLLKVGITKSREGVVDLTQKIRNC